MHNRLLALIGASYLWVLVPAVAATPAAGTLSLSASAYSAAQKAGTVSITVERSGGSTGAVSVFYTTVSGTADASDYVPKNGSLTWTSGDLTPKSFAVSIDTSDPFTGTKQFSVDIKDAKGGADLGAITSATVTIEGAAPPEGELSLSSAAYTVAQNAGSLTFSVERTGGTTGAVSVFYSTADGTANSSNYSPKNGTLSWAAGDASAKTFSVAISAAVPFTGSKQFSVTIKDVKGGAVLGTPTTASATIKGSGGTTSTAQIVVNATGKLAPILSTQVGSNLGAWFDITQAGVAEAVESTGVHVVRWPGGSAADAYHWETQMSCAIDGAWVNPNSTFDNFMTDVVKPASLEAAITVNYGSNASCNGGGEPSEAAAWVAYSKSKGYNVHRWTVGNEEFGSWEVDLHSTPHDPSTYAAAMSGANGFYQLMKGADATAEVGVVVQGVSSWDSTVLTQAPYDYVELHWYAQQPGQESDTYLLNQAPADLSNAIATVRTELASAGKSATPIMLGEFNSVAYNPGKQTMSIVNALFAGMAYGEVLDSGVAVATWWFGYGGGCNNGNNDSSSLYGWQSFGGYDQVSSDWTGCGNSPAIPAGVIFPSGYAAALVSRFAVAGNEMLSVTVAASLSTVRAYAASQGTGYAMMLINLDQNSSATVTLGVENSARTSFSMTTTTYGKAQYDNSKSNVWSGPVTAALGTVSGVASVTLPPWSITVVQLE